MRTAGKLGMIKQMDDADGRIMGGRIMKVDQVTVLSDGVVVEVDPLGFSGLAHMEQLPEACFLDAWWIAVTAG